MHACPMINVFTEVKEYFNKHYYRARIISWRFCVDIFYNAYMQLVQKVDH